MLQDRIRQLRKGKGWTQAHLAERLGLDNWQSVSRLERGETKLDTDRLVRLAGLFGVDPADFFSDGQRPRSRVVPVTHLAVAGLFQPATDIDPAIRKAAILEEDADIAGVDLIGVEIGDDHAEQRYPRGSRVFFVPIDRDGYQPQLDKWYVVERQREDGMRECTVRRYTRDVDDRRWYAAGHPAVAALPARAETGTRLFVLGRILRGLTREP